MVKLFLVLGLALLVGGAYAIFDGWPYRVLERGFTEVILGALSLAAGLLMLAAAVILSEIGRLRTMLAGAMAATALAPLRHDEPAPQPRRAEISLPEPEPQAGMQAQAGPGLGGAAALAGAGAIALGGALTGSSRAGQPEEDRAKAADTAAPVAPVEEAGEPPAAPLFEPLELELPARGQDDWLRPPGLSREAPHGPGLDPETRFEPDFFEAALLPTRAPQLAAEAEEKPAERLAAPVPETQAAAEKQVEIAFEPDLDLPDAETKREPEQLWWPQLDLGAEEKSLPAKAVSDDDDFSALREQLNDALATPGAAPEVEPPRRSLEAVSDWMAPRAWPPVTQPRSSDALAALEEPATTAEAPALAEDRVVPLPEPAPDEAQAAPPATPEPVFAAEADATEIPLEILPEIAPEAGAPAEPEAAAPADQAAGPSASDEGIVGAYQVGETHFTIYADGSIQARTPDGDYVFASMDELKAYLASEKSRLESGSA